LANSSNLEMLRREFAEDLADVGFKELHVVKGFSAWRGRVWPEWCDKQSGEHRVSAHTVWICLSDEFPIMPPSVWVGEELPPGWHVLPGNPQGICLWDQDGGWRYDRSARDLLARIDDWFVHHHTGDWPDYALTPDPQNFMKTRHLGVVITGEKWQPHGDQVSGGFALWYKEDVLKSPALVAATAEGPSSLQYAEDEALVSALGLSALRGGKQSEVECIQGVWFRIASPFVPPAILAELLLTIDQNIGHTQGWAQQLCRELLSRRYRRLAQGFAIALGYGQGVEERWLFLWCAFPNKSKQNYPWEHHLRDIGVGAFNVAPARHSDLMRRSAYISTSLAEKHVTIFGLGALGGPVAALLAKCGVGEIGLVDYDLVTPGIVTRHVCGLADVGLPKVWAVYLQILQHQPYCKVYQFIGAFSKDKIREAIVGCDLVIDTTANPGFGVLLSLVCSELQIPCMTAAMYRRGRVARLTLAVTKGDPCQGCYEHSGMERSPEDYPEIPVAADSEYFVENGCGQVTQEAVALDVEASVNMIARAGIKFLRGEQLSGNVCHLVNDPFMEENGLLAIPGEHWTRRGPVPGCPICEGQGVY
jgi:molybdopterin/thiamine biosynthesis adenylyltransferase